MLVFFFKQKTAYVMRISDWSSDVCSSDLNAGERRFRILQQPQPLLQRRGARRRQTLDQRSGQIGIARRQRLARALFERGKIGRASCRERVCQYVLISVVAVSVKNKSMEYTDRYNN